MTEAEASLLWNTRATRQTTASMEGMVERVARAVHAGRFPDGRDPYTYDEEDEGGKEYCRRIARAALAVTPDLMMVREALEAFASIDPDEYDGAPDDISIERALYEGSQPTVGDLRKARAAYAALPTPEKGDAP